MSKEISGHNDGPVHNTDQNRIQVESGQGSMAPPSTRIAPMMTDSPPQQAAALPGSGDTVQVGDQNKDPLNATEKVPFKEQVIGVAKKTRGTLLGKPSLKQYGEAILQGRTTHDEPKHHSD